MSCRSVIHDNIELLTLQNNYFRKVISTSPQMQVVLMSLKPGEEIGSEVHHGVTQFFRIEKGSGTFHIDYGNGPMSSVIRDGSFMFVPAGSQHNVINTGDTPMKLYTIYSPPNHRCDTVNVNKPVE
jgi:mannose-6-phosphate isomerase-like protein (cupin superfamily)